MSITNSFLRRGVALCATRLANAWRMVVCACLWAFSGSALAAQGGLPAFDQAVSATVLPASGQYPEIVVFYQGKGRPESIERDGVRMQLGWNLPEVQVTHPRRLVVLSHGSDGNPWQHGDLAKQLVHAGFVVAAPFHVGDNSRDHDHTTLTTWTNWQARPAHITATIDAMAHSSRWAVLADKVGVFGMSAGGHTALTMAGGKWSADRLRRHCNRYIQEDFHVCSEGRGQLNGNWLDWFRLVPTLARINYHMREETLHGHAEPRVTVVVAEVPAVAEFDMQSLASSTRAIGVVQALADQYVNPRLHSGALLRACRHCVDLASVPGAGHLSFISPATQQTLTTDAPGFDRSHVKDTHAKVVTFFSKHLMLAAPAEKKP